MLVLGRGWEGILLLEQGSLVPLRGEVGPQKTTR